MDRIRRTGLMIAVGLSVGLAGCNDKILDPTQVGRFRPTPAVNVILDSLGVAEEEPVAWENAQDPRPKDVVPSQGDYALQPGDLVQVSIFELYQEGIPLSAQFLVSETGKISIPEVGVIQAAGLTETQLEEEIKRILSPAILRKPSVTVILLDSQQRTFSMLGNGVSRPGRYVIPRYDFRLTDALAIGGGPMQFNVSTIYVSRRDEKPAAPMGTQTNGPATQELEMLGPQSSAATAPLPLAGTPAKSVAPVSPSEIPDPAQPAEKFELEREMLDLIRPSAKASWPRSEKVVAPPAKPAQADVTATMLPGGFRLLTPPRTPERTSSSGWDLVYSPTVMADEANRPATASEPAADARIEWVFRNGKWVPVPVEPPGASGSQPAKADTDAQVEWVFRDGKWVSIPKGTPTPPPAEAVTRGPSLPLEDGSDLPPELEWEQSIQTRLLRIPADKLLAGDPRYNVVIKPGDTVYVPVDIIGEFFIMGNVNRSGAVNITGRPMTLKMAIAAAGGLGPLAWPKSVEVIRRIGKEKEEIVMVDLDKIASGEQPDFFIKPHDLINVGTHPTSRWRAVLRNAFRAAYGFGFVYDRNFADADYGKGWPGWLW